MIAPEVAFLRARLVRQWHDEAAADRVALRLEQEPDADLRRVAKIVSEEAPVASAAVRKQCGQAAYEALRGAQLVAAAIGNR